MTAKELANNVTLPGIHGLETYPVPGEIWERSWKAPGAASPKELFGPENQVVFHDGGEVTMNLGYDGWRYNRVMYFNPHTKQLEQINIGKSGVSGPWENSGFENIGEPQIDVEMLFKKKVKFVVSIFKATKNDPEKQKQLWKQLTPLIHEARKKASYKPLQDLNKIEDIVNKNIFLFS